MLRAHKTEDEAQVLVVGHKDTLEVCEEQLSNTETRIAAVVNEKVRSELSDPAVRNWLPRRRPSGRSRRGSEPNQLNGDFSLELFKETLPTQH